MGRPRSWTDEQLISAHASARSMRALLTALGLTINGSNNRSIKKHLHRLDLDVPKVVAMTSAETSKRWRRRHPERAKADFKKYQQNNLDKFAEYARNRRALKYGAGGDFTAEEFTALCNQFNNECLSCGSSGPLTADHVKPLSRGGNNYISNIQPLCGVCNSQKHTKLVDYRTGEIHG